MQPIDPADFEKRLERIGEIFSQISQHADVQAQFRCPYKNRLDQCTAGFGCRHKRKSPDKHQPPLCTSDDQLDYRDAWETETVDYDAMRKELRGLRKEKETIDPAAGSVRHGEKQSTSVNGKTIFDFADDLQVRVPTSCSRSGVCHECVVNVKQGMTALCERTEAEQFLNENFRLACQAEVVDASQDIEFGLLRRSPRILQPDSSTHPQVDPAVKRHNDGVCYYNEAIDDYRGMIYGMALDLGTTTVVMELIDLESGTSVYTSSFDNPQRFGGSDVMTRISYDGGRHQGELHRAIINTLNTEILEMCARLGIERHVIYEIVVAGNSTMRDLFFDLNVQTIGQKPYKSVVEYDLLEGRRDSTALCSMARKLRIRANKNARVFGVPLIASHVGGDVVADLVAIDIASQTEIVMLVDVGTNTEIVIGNRDRLVAASCPAGPAFEGGLVTYGMPGYEGAIESVRYTSEGFVCKTIGDVSPVGFCGSGLIDLLAELVRNNLMNPMGVFPRKARELTIVPDQNITFSRADASHLAQAKAANYCGQLIAMRHFGINPDDISHLYLAGGFANYVDPERAVEIGFLAPVPLDRTEKIGNAAAQGARELLLSVQKRERTETLIREIEHIELETFPDFFDAFVEGCQFKPMPAEI